MWPSSSQTAFKIEPFTTLPKGSSPSQKCKVKIILQKKLKFEFYPSNKEGDKYQHFKRSATLEILHPYKFVFSLHPFLFKSSSHSHK